MLRCLELGSHLNGGTPTLEVLFCRVLCCSRNSTFPAYSLGVVLAVKVGPLLCETWKICAEAGGDLVLLHDHVPTNEGPEGEELEEMINFCQSFSSKEFHVEKLMTTENLQEVGLIASHQDVAHLSLKETMQDAQWGDPDEVKEAITVITAKEALKAVKADENGWRIGGDNSQKA
uniref:Uncharacterized protein n=1 Tax=Cannabis sativa TaxID=3483 RepID=A0A803P9E1_CANSA